MTTEPLDLEELKRLTEQIRKMPKGLPDTPEALMEKAMAGARLTGADPADVLRVLMEHPTPPKFVAPPMRFEDPLLQRLKVPKELLRGTAPGGMEAK